MDVYERINSLNAGMSIFCDAHDTILTGHTDNVDDKLIDALIVAQKRGVFVILWTAGGWDETVYAISLIKSYGLIFNDVFMNVIKPDLIIDNLAVSP